MKYAMVNLSQLTKYDRIDAAFNIDVKTLEPTIKKINLIYSAFEIEALLNNLSEEDKIKIASVNWANGDSAEQIIQRYPLISLAIIWKNKEPKATSNEDVTGLD